MTTAGAAEASSNKNTNSEFQSGRAEVENNFPAEVKKDETFQSLSTTSFHVKYQEDGFEPKLYKKRWFIVFLFAFYSASNSFQWIHLNIIGDKILIFYEASLPKNEPAKDVALDMLSLVYMMAYVIFIFPANWILSKKGLHFVGVVGTSLNALGAWLKCGTVDPDRFYLLMCGQCVCATAQVFILGVPARLAAVWFGPNEVSTATSIGVFGNQLGCALGFLIPPMIVSNFEIPTFDFNANETTSHSNVSSFSNVTTHTAERIVTSQEIDHIGSRLFILFYGGAIISSALLVLVIFFFSEKPPSPPSYAQALTEEAANVEEEQYLLSMSRLFRNCSFVLLLLTYGVCVGCYYAIGTLLNPIILYYFSPEQIDPGQVGLVLVMSGVLGSIVSGVWLDKTKLFKITTVVIYMLSCLGMLAFTLVLPTVNVTLVFICAFILGFFMTGYLPVGFEYAAELTYPEPEGTSSGLLNASAQIFGIALTLGIRAMTVSMDRGMLAGNLTITVVLFVGVIGTVLIRGDLRRQQAHKEMSGIQLMSRSISVEKQPE